ncbi:MAG: GGDEF domain-containing protein [Deltaproteobacteria bacterium]|nr:GGDEF domain-containing protein [Deltaproteobacteria bacterium]
MRVPNRRRERPDDGRGARLRERVEALGFGVKAVVTLGLFLSIVAIKYVTGLDVSIRALYLLPVGVATWVLGRRLGVVAGVAGAAVTLYFDLISSFGQSHAAFIYSDAITRLVVYLAATEVIARLRSAHERLAELAETDPLTGLYNRRGFERMAARELARARRTGSALTAVAFDLDGFKSLNDARGHGEGDHVLTAVGDVLHASRATDVACRLGGDEFGMLLADARADSSVRAVERLVASLNDAMTARGWPITFSIGVATYELPPKTPLELLSVADELMYEVKRTGKNGVLHRTVRPGERTEETSGRGD